MTESAEPAPRTATASAAEPIPGGSGALLRDLRHGIATGLHAAGARLPTERALSERYGVSRTAVRRILDELEGAGLIHRHVGRGTFVTGAHPAAQAQTPQPLPVMDERRVNPEEVMEARLLIEPQLAKLVTMRATETELEALEAIVESGGRAESMADFEHWDNRLHRAIADASKNAYLIHIVAGIHAARQAPAWSRLRRRGLTEERRALYQSDHERIVRALAARDAEAAETAIRDHLHHVRRNLMLL